MNPSATKTLLAFLLTLRELKIPLSTDEQVGLQDIGQQLSVLAEHPDYWENIEEELMAKIEANLALYKRYQLNKAKLDALDGQVPKNLLPSLADLKQELFTDSKEITEFNFEYESSEVSDLASAILLTNNPDQTAKCSLAEITKQLKWHRADLDTSTQRV